MQNSLLRPEDVAEFLNVSRSWVYGNKHRIGYLQVGNAVRFEPKTVEEYAKGCRRGPQHKEDRLWDTKYRTEKTAKPGSSVAPSTESVLKELFAQKERLSSSQ